MKALLVIEQTHYITLADKIERYRRDLLLEGWSHEVAFVKAQAVAPLKDPRHIQVAREVIWPWVTANPGGHVVLIGNVPVPFSGIDIGLNEIASDQGALPALTYYVTPGDDIWTDLRTRTTKRTNGPDDGQFDQNTPMRPPLCSIGQINFQHVKYPQWTTGINDDHEARILAYDRYWDLNHAYRTEGWSFGRDFAACHYQQSVTWSNINAFFASRPDLKTQWYWPKSKPQVFADGPHVVWGDFKLYSETSIPFWVNTVPKPIAFLSQFWGSGQGASDSARLKHPVAAGCALTSCCFRNTIRYDYDLLFNGATVGDFWLNAMQASKLTWVGLLGDPTLRIKRKGAV